MAWSIPEICLWVLRESEGGGEGEREEYIFWTN